jgi:hypothetical protein
VRRGFVAVDPSLLAWVLAASETLPSLRMSADGPAWHWQGARYEMPALSVPFVRAALDLAREDSEPRRVRWWINVLREGAVYRSHAHDGKWSFIYHLTMGAPVHFGASDAPETFDAMPGQVLVFESSTPHWVDVVRGAAPRVSIAGNLYYGARR